MSSINGVNNGLPNRISMNVSIQKQSQGSTFGEKVNQGLHAAGNVAAQGASLLGSAGIPGASVLSTAISSVGTMTNAATGGGASSAMYAAQGASTITTVGGSTLASAGGNPVALGAGTSSGANLLAGAGTNGVGQYNTDIASMSAQNAQMLQVQIAMQRENTMFSSISNVLKTKHDTAKNSVSNIR